MILQFEIHQVFEKWKPSPKKCTSYWSKMIYLMECLQKYLLIIYFQVLFWYLMWFSLYYVVYHYSSWRYPMASLPALVLSQFGECLHFSKVNIYIYIIILLRSVIVVHGIKWPAVFYKQVYNRKSYRKNGGFRINQWQKLDCHRIHKGR